MNWRSLGSASLAVFSACPLYAATFTVTSLADSGVGSLRAQVAASSPGDTIQFGVNGTILLNSAIQITHTLFVQGPGPDKLTVSGSFADRVFVTSGNPVVLSGMIIRDGLIFGTQGANGGPGNHNGGDGGAAYGGGILASIALGDTTIISNCWLVHNLVVGGRGGFGSSNPALGPPFAPGNGGRGGAGSGGGLYAAVGSNIVVNCTFSDNHAVGGQGGLGGTNIDSRWNGAGTGGQGGFAYGGAADVSSIDKKWPAFTNCTFSGNFSVGGRGGFGGPNLEVLSGGTGGEGGPGYYGALRFQVQFYLINSTIVSNTATGGPGGTGGMGTPPGSDGTQGPGEIGGVGGYTLGGCAGGVGNTIVADNSAAAYTNILLLAVDLGWNYIGDDDLYVNCFGTPASTRIGSVASPLHPLLGPLLQNGAGLPTHATMTNSPVTDQGFSFNMTTDERGAPRPYVFPSIAELFGGDGSDIGAFELGNPALGLDMSGNNVILSWPAYYGDFTLQSAQSLTPPNNWLTVTGTTVEIGARFVVSNAIVAPSQFYRLSNQ